MFGSTGFGSNANQSSGFGGQAPKFGSFGGTSSSGGLGSAFGTGNTNTNTTSGGSFSFGSSQNNANTGSGSGFGGFGNSANANTSGGLFGGSNQASTGGSGFGGFGSTTQTTGGFGSSQNKPAGGLFGQSTGSTGGSLFGQNNATASAGTGGGLFGQNNATSGTGGGGLFGQNNATGTTSTGGSLFGQNQSSGSGASGGLFGQNQTSGTGASGGLFGQNNATSTTNTGGGLFGQNQSSGTGSGGLFGQKPASGTGGGLFGNTQNNTQSSTGGLFGQNKPAAGGLFGNTNTSTQSSTGGGLFGNTGTTATGSTTGGGLFGNTNTGTTGTTGATGAGSGTGSTGGLFGSNTAKPGGLFGGTGAGIGTGTTGTGSTGGLFGNTGTSGATGTASTGGGGLFGSSTGGATTTSNTNTGLGGSIFGQSFNNNSQPGSLTASIDQVPGVTPIKQQYGPLTASMSRKSVSGNGSMTVSRLRQSSSSFKSSPASRQLIMSMARNSPYAGGARRSARSSLAPSPYTNTGRERKALTDDYSSSLSVQPLLKAQAPSDIKRLTIGKPKRDLQAITGRNPAEFKPRDGMLPIAAASPNDKENGKLDGDANGRANGKANGQLEMTELGTKPQTQPGLAFELNQTAVDEGYWMTPSVADLRMYSREKLAAVPSFVAGRKGYGHVEFLKPVDLTTLKSTAEILGNIIVFGHGTIGVYPDHEKGPGEGLNQPAIVTLHDVYPRHLRGRNLEPGDPQIAVFVNRLRKKIRAKDGEHLSYDFTTKTWVFKVPHFSVWGIASDDEDLYVDDDDVLVEEDMDVEDGQNAPNGTGIQGPAFGAAKPADVVTYNVKEQRVSPQPSANQNFIGFDDDDDDDYDQDADSLLDMSNIVQGREKSAEPAPLAGLASKFLDQNTNERWNQGASPALRQSLTKNQRLELDKPETDTKAPLPAFKSWTQELAPVPAKPVLPTPKDWIGQLTQTSRIDSPFALRDIDGNEKETALVPDLDTMLYGGASSLKDTVAAQYEQAREELRLPGLFEGRPFALFSRGTGRLIVKSTKTASGVSVDRASFGASDKLDLAAHMAKTKIVERESGVPLCQPSPDLTFGVVKGLYGRELWELAAILFDKCDIGSDDSSLSEGAVLKVREEARRRALSDWLARSVSSAVDADVAKAQDELDAIYALVCGHRVTEAAKRAVASRNLHLATVIPLLGSADRDVRADAQAQLADWAANKTAAYIPKRVRQIYELLAGNTTVSKATNDQVHMSDGLDWRRALGLELWYGGSRSTSISETVEKYRQNSLNVSNRVAQAPSGDRCFALLRLYDAISPDLASALESDGLNCRVAWLLYVVLVLAADRFKDKAAILGDNLSVFYASELEASGAWLEALFVYLHVRNESVARRHVQRVLALHVAEISASNELQAKIRSLGIAESLIHEADALRARHDQDHLAEAHSLLAAGLQNEAHDVVTATVAPSAVISENLQLLRDLLKSFHHTDSIPSWDLGGQVYLDYANLVAARQSGNDNETTRLAARLATSLSNIKSPSRFYPRVAVSIMSSYVAGLAISSNAGGPQLLHMKMTRSEAHRRTVDLAVGYFKTQLAAL